METSYETRIINHALKTTGYYPLRAIQLWTIDSHFNKVKSTMMNIGALFKLAPEIDLNRLAQAVNDTLNAHDVFRCRLVFHPETSDICQRFDGELVPVKIEKISDEEFEIRKENLKKPYPLINKPLYRFYLFETPTAKYFFLDFYHAIIDGTAIAVLFWREMNSRYKGKKITHQPLNYADYILDELRVSPEELAEGNKFWNDTLKDFDEKKHLPPVDIENVETWQSETLFAPVKNITQKYFSESKRKESILFLGASMLAIAKTSGSKSAIMDWVHNGRYNAQERRLMGAMLEQFPIRYDFKDNESVKDFLDALEIEMNTGVKYRRSLSTAYNSGLQEICATFIFQKKIHNADYDIGGYPVEIVELPTNEWSSVENTLDIEVNLNEDGTYLVEYGYDASRYSESAMEKFAATFDEIVAKLQDENKLISEILN